MTTALTPKFVDFPAFTVLGLPYRGTGKNGEIPALWHRFPEVMAVATRVSPMAYGVIDHYDPATGEFDYVAGLEVAADTLVPAGMVKWHIKAASYAVFPSCIPILKETFPAIYRDWLPTSGYRRAPGAEFEYYDEQFMSGPLEQGTIWIHIPVLKI